MLHELRLLVLLVDQVDTSQSLVMDEMDSMLHDSSKHEYTCESEQLLQDTLSMLHEPDHLMDYNFQQEHPITIFLRVMPLGMRDGQLLQRHPIPSTLPEFSVLLEVEDTSPNS